MNSCHGQKTAVSLQIVALTNFLCGDSGD